MENGHVENSLMIFRYIQQLIFYLYFFFFMKNSEFFNFRMFNIDYDSQAIFHSDNKVKLIFFLCKFNILVLA